MKQIVITGGNRLKGKVEVSGAKNAVLPVIASTLLTEGISRISNIPLLKDVFTISFLLKSLGARVEIDEKKRTIYIDTSSITQYEAPYDLVKTMRASCLVMGPLLARMGKAKVSLPGGCSIGERPINLHIKGFESLGADITLKSGYILAKGKQLKGANIYLDIPTVTGTENLIMAAVLAKGTTVIENAAKEPEIVNFVEVINSMGGRITGGGTDIITVKGVSGLSPVNCRIIPDRIEAATYMVAAAITGGEVTIENCIPEHMDAVIAKLIEAGVKVSTGEDIIKVKGGRAIKPLTIKTSPYPGFPTDMQAQVMALMTLANGVSVITENIFENRFMHVSELKRMGADITVESHTAYIRGISRLQGAEVMATDLRASASLILAGLAARGRTIISRIYHLDRGYESMENKLKKLGACIDRV